LNLFYTPDVTPQLHAFILSEEESKHAVRVLRMADGHQVHLVDGRGGLYTAIITDAHPKRTVIEIIDVHLNYEKRPYHLHMAVAPTKNIDRMEWFLEKATEIGIDEVTPIICEHSERREIKIERLNKVMISAIKQSLKAYLPKINLPVKFDDFIRNQHSGYRFIAHCTDGEKRFIGDLLPPAKPALILIGPEGDFSATEIDAALSTGYEPISLGTSRLRTETAALQVCIEITLLNRH